AFVAKPGQPLFPTTQDGVWTLVENGAGDAGWIPTAMLIGEAGSLEEPSDPYAKPEPPKKPRPKDPHVDMPEVLTTPTGWLLPAAVLYSRTSIDTGGGLSSDARVGLGDVAEFGVATTDA